MNNTRYQTYNKAAERGGKGVSYGELIGGKSFSLTVDHQKPPKTKDAKDFKIVGKSISRLDIPNKVTGTFTYMQDFRIPGMLLVAANPLRPRILSSACLS